MESLTCSSRVMVIKLLDPSSLAGAWRGPWASSAAFASAACTSMHNDSHAQRGMLSFSDRGIQVRKGPNADRFPRTTVWTRAEGSCS